MEPNREKRISPSDGPIAVTGASGYIGSWIVKDCLEQGYTVHACVRDKNKAEKIDHLQKLFQERLLSQNLRELSCKNQQMRY